MVSPHLFSPSSSHWKKIIAAFCMTLVMTLFGLYSARLTAMTSIHWQRSQGPLMVSADLVDIESVQDLPFWVWVVLPRLFPEKLPGAGGYTSLGLTWEPGNELPIGFTKETQGIPRVVLRDPSIVDFDLQRYTQFLIDCASDPRFNPNFILPEISYNINLSGWEKWAYRLSVIPKTKKIVLAWAEKSA